MSSDPQRESFDEMDRRIAAEVRAEEIEEGILPMSSDHGPRLRALAKQAAQSNHCRWKEGTKRAVAAGHVGSFMTCPHPDCVLVRASASAPPETGEIEVIVNGQPVRVEAGNVRDVIAQAINLSGQIGAPIAQWQLRTTEGDIIPHELTDGTDYELTPGRRLWLNLGLPPEPVGASASALPPEKEFEDFEADGVWYCGRCNRPTLPWKPGPRELHNLMESVRIENERIQAIGDELGIPKPEDRQGYTGPHTAFSIIAALRSKGQPAASALPEKEQNMSNDIPRRNRMDQWGPAERAIYDAVQAVEAMAADVRLTDAVILLQAARDSVADYTDNMWPCRRYVHTQPVPSSSALSPEPPDTEQP